MFMENNRQVFTAVVKSYSKKETKNHQETKQEESVKDLFEDSSQNI